MKFSHILLIIVLTIATTFAAIHFIGPAASVAPHETAYDRVIRTGVLKCGYWVFAPVSIKDPNTGKLSGLAVDMTEKLAADAHLKVEWVEEADFVNWVSGLAAGRFDALCTPTWPDANLARVASFTQPAFYSGINVYARGDDHRFDDNFAAIDNPSVTIAVIEGTPQVILAEAYFPKAKLLLLPQNAPGGTQAENVVTKKADLLLWDENGVYEYLKTNPGGLHNVAPSHPLRVMPFEYAVSAGEFKLRDLLDTGLQTLQDTGFTEQKLDQWERAPHSFYRTTKPYALPNIK